MIDRNFSIALSEGHHNIEVVFSKYDSAVVGGRTDRLVIHELEVSGVAKGINIYFSI